MKYSTQSVKWDDATTSNLFFSGTGRFSVVVFLCPRDIFDELALLFFFFFKQCWRVLNLFHTKNPESLTLWLAVRDPLLDPSLQQRFPDIWGKCLVGRRRFYQLQKESTQSTKQRDELWAPGWEQGIQGMMISIIFHGTAGHQWDKNS